jgi:hypothetical protein
MMKKWNKRMTNLVKRIIKYRINRKVIFNHIFQIIYLAINHHNHLQISHLWLLLYKETNPFNNKILNLLIVIILAIVLIKHKLIKQVIIHINNSKVNNHLNKTMLNKSIQYKISIKMWTFNSIWLNTIK